MISCPRSLVSIALVTALSGIGCSQERDPYLVVMLTIPRLAERPGVLEPGVCQATASAALADVLLGVPAGWEAGSVRIKDEGNDWAGYGLTVVLPLVVVQHDRRMAGELVYRQEKSWMLHYPPGMLETLRHATTRPEQFLRQFTSDLALLDEACQTVPDDLRGKVGAGRERVLALLVIKRYQPLPTKRLATERLTAFVFRYPADPMVYADLFDAAGRRRGIMALEVPDAASSAETEALFAQLLASTTFNMSGSAAP